MTNVQMKGIVMSIKEVFSVSFQSIRSNKMRTMLTMLGVVVGIFSIIVIMTIITMLQNSIENGLSMLNKNTFQIQKFPAMQMGGPGSRHKFRNRKDITLEDYDRLERICLPRQNILVQNNGSLVK